MIQKALSAVKTALTVGYPAGTGLKDTAGVNIFGTEKAIWVAPPNPQQLQTARPTLNHPKIVIEPSSISGKLLNYKFLAGQYTRTAGGSHYTTEKRTVADLEVMLKIHCLCTSSEEIWGETALYPNFTGYFEQIIRIVAGHQWIVGDTIYTKGADTWKLGIIWDTTDDLAQVEYYSPVLINMIVNTSFKGYVLPAAQVDSGDLRYLIPTITDPGDIDLTP